MTGAASILSVKNRILSILSFGTADAKEIAELMDTNVHNIQSYLFYLDKQGLIKRVNPGSRRARYDLHDKDKEELVLAGRKR